MTLPQSGLLWISIVPMTLGIMLWIYLFTCLYEFSPRTYILQGQELWFLAMLFVFICFPYAVFPVFIMARTHQVLHKYLLDK